MFKKTGLGFTITALILAGSIWALTNSGRSSKDDGFHFYLGIDLRGGTELTYQLDLSKVEYDVGSSNIADVVKDMVAARLDAFGLKELVISTQGSERLVIQLPGAADSQFVEDIKRQIEEIGKLEFTLVVDPDERQGRVAKLLDVVRKYNQDILAYLAAKEANPDDRTLREPPVPQELRELRRRHEEYRRAMIEYEKAYKATRPSERDALAVPEAPEFIVLPRAQSEELESGAKRFTDEPGSLTVLRYGPENEYRVSGKHLKSADIIRDEFGRPAIGFSFDAQGATYFSQITGTNEGKLLAIVLDDRILQSPTIQSRISDRGQITGDFTYEEVQGVVNILRGGSLPTKPTLISQTTVGSHFGDEAIRSGFTAIASGLVIVMIFMLIYYTVGGFVANVALLINMILILTYVLVFRQTLTFPGIAGVLLTIGMAVDANILIFERVREEKRKGKSLVAALGTGYQRAFWVIFDSNLTTLITGIVLFQFGTGPIKGFAVTLVAGIIASFFTAVFVTRLILSFMINRNILRGFPMLRLIGVPRVDFQSYRRPFVLLSILMIAVTWGVFVLPRGADNYGIDFVGGSKVTMKFSRPLRKTELDAMINALPQDEKEAFGDFSIQTVGAQRRGEAREFVLLTRPRKLDAEKATGKASAQEPIEGGAPAGPPPPAAGGGDATPAVAADAEDEADRLSRDEQRVKQILERILKEREEGLLLPEPFPRRIDENGREIPNPRWVPAPREPGGPATEPGVQGAEMAINVSYVDPSLTDERLKELLNEHLRRQYADIARPESTDPEAFRGIQVLELRQLSRRPLPGADNEMLTQYLVRTTGYRAPDRGLDRLSELPTQLEVVETIKSFFRGSSEAIDDAFAGAPGRRIELSEPFPEVVTIGPRVATNLQQQAIIAIFIAIVAIIFYLSLRFEFVFGLAAICALVHDVLITLGIMAMTDALLGDVFSLKINLPEVAAFLTIIGYSVNDTIVVFDRIRENLRAGKRKISFEDLVNASINQTLARTIWTSSTTLVVVLSLLLLGGEPIKGFTFAFAIGLVAGTYSTVFVAGPALIFLRRRALERAERIKAEAQTA